MVCSLAMPLLMAKLDIMTFNTFGLNDYIYISHIYIYLHIFTYIT